MSRSRARTGGYRRDAGEAAHAIQMSLRDRAERMRAGPPVRRAPCEIGNSRSFADRHDRRHLAALSKKAGREQYCTDSAGNRALNPDSREALPYALDVLRNIEKPPVSGPGVFFVTRGYIRPHATMTHIVTLLTAVNEMSAAALERGGATGSAALQVALAALREEFDLRFDAKRFRRQALVEQGFGLGLKQASIAFREIP